MEPTRRYEEPHVCPAVSHDCPEAVHDRFRDGSGPVLALDHDDVWGTGVVDGGDVDVDAASGQRQCPLDLDLETAFVQNPGYLGLEFLPCRRASIVDQRGHGLDVRPRSEQAAYLFRLRRDSISGPSAKRRHLDGRSNSSGADDPLQRCNIVGGGSRPSSDTFDEHGRINRYYDPIGWDRHSEFGGHPQRQHCSNLGFV